MPENTDNQPEILDKQQQSNILEDLQKFALNYLRTTYDDLPDYEKKVIQTLAKPFRVSKNKNKAWDENLTFGQRVADKVASFGGSWPFIFLFGAILISWIIINTVLLTGTKSFDPFPYILLNLFLSMLAAIQAPIIMMSQNRQAAKDRQDAMLDYQVNLKAELEIALLHEKMDQLREEQWSELVRMQQEQIKLLTELLEKRA